MQIKEKKFIRNLKRLYIILTWTTLFLYIVLIAGVGIIEAKEKEQEGLHPNAVNKRYTGHKISLDFKDVNIREVFIILQAISGKKIIVADNVTGRVTLSIKNAPWDQVLDQVALTHGLKRSNRENSIMISSMVKSKKKGIKRKSKKSTGHVTATKEKQKSKNIQHKSFTGNRKLYAGFLCEYVFQGLDVQQTKDKFETEFISDVEIHFSNASGFQLRGGYIYSEYISFEGLFEYLTSFSADIEIENKDNLGVMNITMGLKGFPPVSGRFRPYGLLAIGALNAFEDISNTNETSKTSDWGPVYRGGIGLDMVIFPDVSTMFELGYIIGSGSVSHIRYASLGFGLYYHFK